jgi:hypothetical protein
MSYSFAMRRLVLVSLAVLVLVPATGAAPPPPAVTNVIVITMDGLRWQELFGGAERSLMGNDEKAITGSSSYRNGDTFHFGSSRGESPGKWKVSPFPR